MTVPLRRRDDESVAEYSARMDEVVRLIHGTVQSHAGMGFDVDDVIDDLDFIAEHGDDPHWDECWRLRHDIDRAVSRMTDPTRLRRVLDFAREMSGHE